MLWTGWSYTVRVAAQDTPPPNKNYCTSKITPPSSASPWLSPAHTTTPFKLKLISPWHNIWYLHWRVKVHSFFRTNNYDEYFLKIKILYRKHIEHCINNYCKHNVEQRGDSADTLLGNYGKDFIFVLRDIFSEPSSNR